MSIDVPSRIDVPTQPRSKTTNGSLKRRAPDKAPRTGGWWKRGILAAGAIAVIAMAASLILGAISPPESGPKLTHTIARRDLDVTVTEQGTLESSSNTEVRCKVRGANSTIVSIIENGTEVKPGDVLVRIDTSTIEDNINTQEIAYQTALATYAQSESDVAVAKINITEYKEGTFRSELKTKEMDVAIAEANLRSAQNILNHSQQVFRKGYVSKLELETSEFALQQAELDLEVKQTDLDVLKRYTKAKQIQDLEGILAAKEAKLASDKAALDLEKAKLDREKKQLENCVILAETNGMAIYGSSEKWEDRPDIREGATVREDQVLLLIPDLSQMQVKVSVHEASVDRVKAGLRARIDLQDRSYDGEVLSVAPMAERAGWWNGNMVKYETTIKLDTQVDVKPGMSADVEIFLAQYDDVITIPVGAVVEQDGQYFCWVKTVTGTQKRELDLGDTDDQFMVVNAGVKEGDEVVLNPIAYIEEAQTEALKPFSGLKSTDRDDGDAKSDDPSGKSKSGKPESAEGKQASQKSKPQITGAAILKAADKNGDGVLTKDEFSDKDRKDFENVDQDNNGKVDASELDAVIKQKMGEA